jgi:hypothetical protein
MVDLKGEFAKGLLDNLRSWHETIKNKGLADNELNLVISSPDAKQKISNTLDHLRGEEP